MTKIMKKFSALLLTLALVITMMPALSLGVYAADDDVLTAGINGESKGGVTAAWMEENKEAAQIFPYASRQGNEWGYIIAEGPSYEAFLLAALGIDDISEIQEGTLVWTATDGVFKNTMTVDELVNAKTQFKLVDQDGNDIVGAFGKGVDTIKSAEVVAIEGAAAVTPVIATAHSAQVYATYEEAAAALADESWKEGAETDLRPYVAGNLGAKTMLKVDGTVDMNTPNFTGRFSVANPVSVDVQGIPVDVLSASINGGTPGSVTDKWMNENKEAAQIFPYASRQGNEWGYIIAEGPSYEAFLLTALGIDDLSEIQEGTLVWTATDGVFKNTMTVDELMNAKTQFKLVDQNGNDIVGAFGKGVDTITSAEVVAIEGAAAVTPVIATAHSAQVYATYEEAAAALADESWKEGVETDLRPYVAGNLGAKTMLKVDGAVDMNTPNFTGRFSVANPVIVDVQGIPVDVLSASINGGTPGSVTDKWMEENKEAAQIFPYASRQGNEWGYIIAEGPSYEAFLLTALGIEDISELQEGTLVWTATDGVFKNTMTVDELMNAKTQFKLVDQDGNDIVGAFGKGVDTITSAEVVAIEGAAAVTPVIATAHSAQVYATYEDAAAALADESWKEGAETDLRPYVAGNLGAKTMLKVDGAVDMNTPNFTGRFSVANPVIVDVQIAAPATAKSSLTFTKTTAKTVSVKCSDFIIDLFGGLTWKSSNTKIAKVDKSGKVTPTGIGKCTVKATLGSGDVAAEVAVTVKEAAFKPGAPKSPKATNVKTKSVKLTWKKVSAASGYEIYRSTKSKSGFKKVTTVKKNSTVKYTNKKLKKGKTYYYKIRAYKTVNGKKVYSSYTKVLKVKIKK